jgi:hypothetical protein
MNRLMQRLAHLELALAPNGRGIVIFEDIYFEDTEARIERCLAEVGRSPRDMIIILRDFSDPDEIGPRQPRLDPPWRVNQAPAVSQSFDPAQRPPRPAERQCHELPSQ